MQEKKCFIDLETTEHKAAYVLSKRVSLASLVLSKPDKVLQGLAKRLTTLCIQEISLMRKGG